MRRRGYAVVFALVLLAALVGGFVGGRFLIRRLQADFGPSATWTPPTQTVVGAAQPPPVTSPPAVQPTHAPTRVGLVVPTPVGVEPIPAAATSIPATAAAPGENSAPSAADMTPTPTPTSTVLPDAPPTLAFQFAVAGNAKHSAGDCPGSYILGQVTDRAGNPLANIQLLLTDEYGNQERKATKAGADAGRYDFPLFGPPRRFFLTVVDDNGRPLSSQVEIPHGVGANPSATCHWVYWRRR